MKITKNQVHKDLRKQFGVLDMLSFFFRRKWTFQYILSPLLHLNKGKNVKNLDNEEIYIPSRNNGPKIRLKVYKPQKTSTKLPIMLYLHGGGFAIGCPEQYGTIYKQFIEKRPCIIVAPDYRKSIKDPYPAGFNDCYDTLLWINENSNALGAMKNNIIVAGHSAGGGLTAAVTLKARDTQDVNIAFQMPFYPMLDDRQASKSAQFIVPIWDVHSNKICWDLYLRTLKENHLETPFYAAPARNKDYTNFPPTIAFVGEWEPFSDETVEYVENLRKYNIPTEFKFYKGCFHGFDVFAANTEVGKDAIKFTYDRYARYYDRYILGS